MESGPLSVTALLPAPSSSGQPFDPSLLLAQATSNIICSLTFGLRFPYEDEEFQTVVRAAGGAVLGISSPWGQVRGWDPSSSPKVPAYLSQVTPRAPLHAGAVPGPMKIAVLLPCPSQAYEMFSQLLRHLPGPHTQLLGHLSILATFAVQQVQRHKGSLDTSGPACDVVDAFLQTMAEVGEGQGWGAS